MDDVDILAGEKIVVVLVPVNAERPGERIELLTVGPGRGNQLGARLLRQRLPQVVAGIPVAEASDRDAPRPGHQPSS